MKIYLNFIIKNDGISQLVHYIFNLLYFNPFALYIFYTLNHNHEFILSIFNLIFNIKKYLLLPLLCLLI